MLDRTTVLAIVTAVCVTVLTALGRFDPVLAGVVLSGQGAGVAAVGVARARS